MASLHILRLVAENILRLKAVDITPNGNIVALSGQNNAGKSSILNVIWLAMKQSAASKHLPMPIRHGEDKGYCMLDLGDFVVKRWFTLDEDEEVTTRLVVENANGDVVKRPQELLDSFVSSLSYDPLDFIRADGKKRKQILADIIGLNLADYEARTEKLVEERKILKRDKAELQTLVGKIAPPTADEPTTETSATDLIQYLDSIKEKKMVGMRKRELIAALAKEADELAKKWKAVSAELEKANKDFKIEDTPGYFDNEITKVTEQLQNLEAHNRRARDIGKYYENIQKAQETQAKLSDVEKGIEDIRNERMLALMKADLPIVGLSITDEDVLFNDLPLSQASTSEQWKVSLAIGMVANPRFRVLRIKDGSVLDKQNLQILHDLAKEEDFQIWIEFVDDSEKLGFYIENGEVKVANQCTI